MRLQALAHASPLHLLDPFHAANYRYTRRQSPWTRRQQFIFALDGVDFRAVRARVSHQA